MPAGLRAAGGSGDLHGKVALWKCSSSPFFIPFSSWLFVFCFFCCYHFEVSVPSEGDSSLFAQQDLAQDGTGLSAPLFLSILDTAISGCPVGSGTSPCCL